MRRFYEVWELLSPKVEYANRRQACYKLWLSLTENQRETLYENISEKLSNGKYVDYNPLFAMKNNCQQPQLRRETLTFQQYYERYGTTEPQDGWKMENPTGEQVIFVKT